MSYPIYNMLSEYISSSNYPFHMPGHKRNINFFPETLIKNLLNYDLTEINKTDNMHNPTGIIKESLEEIAENFGADKSYFSVNGSSAGIISAIMASCPPNSQIVTARNCHISTYNGIILSRLNPIYIYPEITNYNICGGINYKNIKNALEKYNNISAVIITSPTYEGYCSNIKEIADIVHLHNKILIVDEAHGCHFAFSDSFPKTSLESGADIVIQSMHKTLPVPNQCALIHTKGNRIDENKLKNSLSIMQTTSPSYIFMTIMDYVNTILKKEKNTLFKNYSSLLDELKINLQNNKCIEFIGNKIKNKYCIYDVDISKIVLYLNCNLNGYELEKILADKYKVQIEASSINHIIAMTSIADTKEGFKRFSNAINSIEKNLNYKKKNKINYKTDNIYTPEISLSEAYYSNKKTVPFNKSAGNISSEFIIPYPPGIPLIAPGEIITENTIEIVNKFISNNVSIIGTNDISLKNIDIIK